MNLTIFLKNFSHLPHLCRGPIPTMAGGGWVGHCCYSQLNNLSLKPVKSNLTCMSHFRHFKNFEKLFDDVIIF
jgi:hypothetical protein